MALVGMFAFACGRGPIKWTVAAYFFGWMVFVPLLLMPMKKEKHLERMDMINTKAEDYGIKKEVGNINTVDDLFKQLETK